MIVQSCTGANCGAQRLELSADLETIFPAEARRAFSQDYAMVRDNPVCLLHTTRRCQRPVRRTAPLLLLLNPIVRRASPCVLISWLGILSQIDQSQSISAQSVNSYQFKA